MCVGLFSLERSGPNGIIHMVSAIIAFIGFVFSILFFSIPALLHQNLVYKLFGLSGVFIPLLMLFLNCIVATPLLEWSLLFSILLIIFLIRADVQVKNGYLKQDFRYERFAAT